MGKAAAVHACDVVTCDEDFQNRLKKRGVRSKKLRENQLREN